MEYKRIGNLTLNFFDKNNKDDLIFLKKLCFDESIKERFQGITIGLLNNHDKEFFGHGFLVKKVHSYIGYLGIGDFDSDNCCVYLRAAIDKDLRGYSYGKMLLSEITNYIFSTYPEVLSIRLKIDKDNVNSLMTANSCDYEWLEKDIYVRYKAYFNVLK